MRAGAPVIMVPGTYMPCSYTLSLSPPFLDHLESFPFLLNVLATFRVLQTVLTKRSSILAVGGCR